MGRFPDIYRISMRTTRTLSISLPYEMADYIRAKVSTGEFATESEVIRDALRTLIARDRVVEAWLRDAVNSGEFALDPDAQWAADKDEAKPARPRRRPYRPMSGVRAQGRPPNARGRRAPRQLKGGRRNGTRAPLPFR